MSEIPGNTQGSLEEFIARAEGRRQERDWINQATSAERERRALFREQNEGEYRRLARVFRIDVLKAAGELGARGRSTTELTWNSLQRASFGRVKMVRHSLPVWMLAKLRTDTSTGSTTTHGHVCETNDYTAYTSQWLGLGPDGTLYTHNSTSYTGFHPSTEERHVPELASDEHLLPLIAAQGEQGILLDERRLTQQDIDTATTRWRQQLGEFVVSGRMMQPVSGVC